MKKVGLGSGAEDEALAALVARIAATRNDAARHRLILGLAKDKRDDLVGRVDAAFAAQPDARFIEPSVLCVLFEKKKPGARDALRPLLIDKNRSARGNAAEAAREYGWGAAMTKELVELITRFAAKDGFGMIAALKALGDADTDEAFRALSKIAKGKFKAPLFRAEALKALAKYQRPATAPLFKAAAKERDPLVRQAGFVGLAHLGDRAALDTVRADLDQRDVRVATPASIALHGLLGTPLAIAPAAMRRLGKWWDEHPREVDAKFAKAGKRR